MAPHGDEDQKVVEGVAGNTAELIAGAEQRCSTMERNSFTPGSRQLPWPAKPLAAAAANAPSQVYTAALPVVQSARARPVSPRYTEVSEIIRTNLNAFLAGTKTADQALGDMKSRLGPILR